MEILIKRVKYPNPKDFCPELFRLMDKELGFEFFYTEIAKTSIFLSAFDIAIDQIRANTPIGHELLIQRSTIKARAHTSYNPGN